MKLSILIEKYGFLLVLLFCLGVFQPALYPKVSMMDADLDNRILSKSNGNAFKQIFWIGLFFFYLFKLYLSKHLSDLPVKFVNSAMLIFCICLVALISVLWSDFPSLTIKRSIFQIVFCSSVLLSFYFSVFHQNTVNNIQLALYIVYFLIILTVVMGWGLTSGHVLVGFTKGKNVLGASITVLFVMTHFLVNTYSLKIKYLSLHFIALFSIVFLTQSKTNLVLIILYLLLVRLNKTIIKATVSSLFVFFVSLFLLLPFLSGLYGDYITIGDLISDDFLTGRGIIWDTLYYDLFFFDKYTLGYGYGAYFGTPSIPYFFDDPYSFLQFITSPHNGYIDLLLQFGYVFTFLILMIFILLYKTLKSPYIISAMIIPLIHNFTEASIFRDNTMVWLLFIVAVAASSLHPKGVLIGKN